MKVACLSERLTMFHSSSSNSVLEIRCGSKIDHLHLRMPHLPSTAQLPDVPNQRPPSNSCTMPSPRVTRPSLANRRLREACEVMRIRRPLGGTRAQTVIRGALLVSIASVLAVVNTAACATAPRMRERAPIVRSRTDIP